MLKILPWSWLSYNRWPCKSLVFHGANSSIRKLSDTHCQLHCCVIMRFCVVLRNSRREAANQDGYAGIQEHTFLQAKMTVNISYHKTTLRYAKVQHKLLDQLDMQENYSNLFSILKLSTYHNRKVPKQQLCTRERIPTSSCIFAW